MASIKRQEREMDRLLKENGIVLLESGDGFGFKEPEQKPTEDGSTSPEGTDDHDSSVQQDTSSSEPPADDRTPEQDGVLDDSSTDQGEKPPQAKKPVEQKHDWEKRERDAKDAQRLLSQERSKLEAERLSLESLRASVQKDREELTQLLNDARSMKEQVGRKVAPVVDDEPEADEDPLIKQIQDEYPDLAKFVNHSTEKLVKRLSKSVLEKGEKLDQVLAELEKQKEDSRNQTARSEQENLFMEILDVHPDAFEVAKDDKFRSWLTTMPPIFSDIIDKTTNYNAQDAIHVLNTFKSLNSAKKPAPRPSDADVDVPVRSQSSGVRSDVPGGDSDIFSDEEMSEIHLLANKYKSKAQREEFDKKLERTINRMV